MNVPEFKAWFAGITATMGPQPTIEQWDLIKKEVQALGLQVVAGISNTQGPFKAQDKISKADTAKDIEDPLTKAIRDMERARKQKEQEEGIPGFPKGWPSKQAEGWPYDPDHNKHWLKDRSEWLSGTGQATDGSESTVVVFLNPRNLT